MDNLEKYLSLPQTNNDFSVIFLSLIFCALSGYLLKFFYDKYSNYDLSNKKISSILPILTVVTFLIITVIKSSIALSLGLVGALSIVRFRTPIKEPEELLFLFLSIALGIGYGSNQIYLTSLIFIFILIFLWFYSGQKKNFDYNISIQWEEENSNHTFLETIKKDSKIKILKIELNNNQNLVLGKVHFNNTIELNQYYQSLKEKLKGCEISIFYEENTF